MADQPKQDDTLVQDPIIDTAKGADKKWPREEDFVEPVEEQASPTNDQVTSNDSIPSLEGPKIESLERQLTEMEQKAQENWSEMMRARAEVENIRVRAERDVANGRKFAIEKFAVELLPVMDCIELGLQNRVDGDSITAKVFEGLVLTRDIMSRTLEKFGVKAIDPIGKPFDPALHQAVSTQPAEGGVAVNTVVAVMQKGYQLNERLIRPAMVVVAK